jgi:predicted RNA-binding protein YlxR (DUF448 family)
MDEVRLIRFVASPDGEVVFDVGRKLPGRGLWVAADRTSVDLAVKKNLFSRAARKALSPPFDLSDQVARLLHRRLLAALGLARKAGDLTSGFERVLAAISSGKAAFLVEAEDGAVDGRRKLLGAGRRCSKPPRLIGLFSSEELGLAIGGETVIHSAFLAGRGADRWTDDVERISGFRPLFPERWREEP